MSHSPKSPMSEREKMLAGGQYNPRDPDLLARHRKARELCIKLAQCPPPDPQDPQAMQAQQSLMRQLLGGMGDGVWIESPFFCDYGENIFIGDNSFVNMNCVFLDCNAIHIGKNVLIGPNVQLYAVSHPVHAEDRVMPRTDPQAKHPPFGECSAPIHIGDNCWLGGSAVVVQGVRIGNNVTIGAGSVVTRDIPDNVLAVGNPCRIIRELPPR